MATNENVNLNHDEVWDDSELIDSWNEALEEYKKYHSLAARGEKVDLNNANAVSDQPPLKSKAEAYLLNGSTPTQQASDRKPRQRDHPSGTSLTTTPVNFIGPAPPPSVQPQATFGAPSQASGAAGQGIPAPPGLASLPQTLLGSGHDEALKNIMMSWYYAGYYTGFYEGQQKAWADMQNMPATQ